MKELQGKDMPEVGGGLVIDPEPAEEPLLPAMPYVTDYPGEPVIGVTDPGNIELAR